MTNKNDNVELNEWLKKFRKYSSFGNMGKEHRGGQYLMNCSWFRKPTVQDRNMQKKYERKKERSLFCYCNKKIRMEHFWDSILPIFSSDGANVQQESEETAMSK